MLTTNEIPGFEEKPAEEMLCPLLGSPVATFLA